jgi:hypothetical protein
LLPWCGARPHGDPAYSAVAVLNAEVGGAESQVSGVADGLVEELGDVVVVDGVGDAAALPHAVDQAEMAQQPQMVGDCRVFVIKRGDRAVTRARA